MKRESGKSATESAKKCKPDEKTRSDFYIKAVAKSLVPIHPGVPGKTLFWNSCSTQFKYAPAFDFKPVTGASRYRFTAKSGTDKKDYVFEAAEPWVPLTPI